VLHGRLTPLVAAASIAVLAACSEGGAIEEGVVRPGITAITEDAPAAACTVNAGTLRSAIESYTLLEGEPPANEQALIDAGYLRSDHRRLGRRRWRARGPEPGLRRGRHHAARHARHRDRRRTADADELYASFDQPAIDALGGEACARELVAIIAAAETYLAELQSEPPDIEALVTAGYLPGLPERWALVGGELIPAAGSGCDLPE
jgi:hypothetical protein